MLGLNSLTGGISESLKEELITEYKSCLRQEDALRVRKAQIRRTLRMTPRSLKQIVLETIHSNGEYNA